MGDDEQSVLLSDADWQTERERERERRERRQRERERERELTTGPLQPLCFLRPVVPSVCCDNKAVYLTRQQDKDTTESSLPLQRKR
jgi:hypothetical protein